MKILIIATHYKPGFKAGGPIQSVYNLSKLISNWAEIHILTKSNDLGSLVKYNVVENVWSNFENHKVKYIENKKFGLSAILSEVRNLNIDLIYFNSLFSTSTWQFLLFNYFKPQKIKIVVAPRGELDEGALKLKKLKKVFFLKLFKLIVRQNVSFHATTEIEKKNINSKFSNNIKIAYNVPKLINLKPNKELKLKENTNLVFISRISPKKNLKYCIEILLKLKINGQLNFDIIGPKEDINYWNEIEKLSQLLPENISVNYIGEMSNDQLLQNTKKYHFLFFPTLAENYGHVIYECLSYGIPVIISNNTPWKQNDNGIFVTSLDLPENFVKIIKELHTFNNTQFEIESQKAFDFAKKSININNLINSYKILFDANSK